MSARRSFTTSSGCPCPRSSSSGCRAQPARPDERSARLSSSARGRAQTGHRRHRERALDRRRARSSSCSSLAARARASRDAGSHAHDPVSLAWLPPAAETIALRDWTPETCGRWCALLCSTLAVRCRCSSCSWPRARAIPCTSRRSCAQLQETDGIVVEDGEARLRAADLTVPATIRDIIAARVDRLAESPKQTLQVASVVGRRFGVTLRVPRAREPSAITWLADLQDLHAVDFVFPSADDPELMYSFKHALTQDVVYASLLERRRRRFHAAAGAVSRSCTPDAGDVVELLAYHFEHSGEDEKAVDYAILAAEKAQRRWANTEALAYFGSALKRLEAMPDTRPNRLRRIDAVVKQSEIMFALGRHAEHVKALEAIRDAGGGGRRPSPARRLVLLDRLPAQPRRRPVPRCRSPIAARRRR